LSIDFAYVANDGASKHGPRVVVGWEQAAALRDMLGKMIQRYEREFGPIRPFGAEANAAAEAEAEAVGDAEGSAP
jgi:hypothetical protein